MLCQAPTMGSSAERDVVDLPTEGTDVTDVIDRRTAPDLDPATTDHGRRHLRPELAGLGVAALAVAVATVAVTTDRGPLFALAGLLLLTVLGDGLLAWRALPDGAIELDPAEPLVADRVGRWTFRRGPVTRPITVDTGFEPPEPVRVGGPDPGPVLVPEQDRGILFRVVVDLRAVGPVGLVAAARRVAIAPAEPAVIGPGDGDEHDRWPFVRGFDLGVEALAPLGDEQFRNVREYRRGDQRRRIDWKSTARHRELMVREDDGAGIVALQVVVSLDDDTADEVCGHAARLVEDAWRRGWTVRLVTLDDTPDQAPALLLGSPFVDAPPDPAAFGTGDPLILAQLVSSPDTLARQLATAVPGEVPDPPWYGTTCRVSSEGVAWR